MFLVCGEALFDVFPVTEPDSLTSSIDLRAVAGGSPYNVAIGLRRLGSESAFLACLSVDPFGRRLHRLLEQEGVSPAYLQGSSAPTTLAMVALDEQGSPHYDFRGDGCADRQISSLPSLGADIRGIHVGSYSLVVAPIGDVLLELVKREGNERLISLDPNVRLNVEPDTARWRARIEAFAGYAHLIKVSEEDLDHLYSEQEQASAIDRWLGQDCRIVVVTHGDQGSRVHTRHVGSWAVPAQATALRDTVGAGDTFQASMLSYLDQHRCHDGAALDNLTREAIDEMLRFASAAAAVTCSRTGPDLPYRHEVEAVL